MKVAILGAVHGTTKEEIEIFDIYAKVCRKFLNEDDFLIPSKIDEHRNNFIKNNPNASEKDIDKDMVLFDLEKIVETKFIIADVSYRSTGLGMELALCFNKKVVLFSKEGTNYSNMVNGGFPDAPVIKYLNKTDLEEKLIGIFEKFKIKGKK